MPELATLRAVVFDCYGCLVDTRAGVRAYVEPILAAHRQVTFDAWWTRWKRIERQMLTPYRPYREVMARAYDAAMQFFGLEAFVDAGPGLGRAVSRWQPYPDATASLRRLGRRRRLGIVANMDPEPLGATVGQLQAPLSCLVSAAEAQAYLPDARLVTLALERLGLDAAAVLVVSTSWERALAPARALGCATALVARGVEAPSASAGAAPDLTLPTLTTLADALA